MIVLNSKDIINNNVPSNNQTLKRFDYDLEDNPVLKILFVGNSITLHSPKTEIGWYGNWGMAASCQEKDYVHIVLKTLRQYYGAVSACIVCAAEWERNYWDKEILTSAFREGRDFEADIILLRIGENAYKCITEEHDFYQGYRMMAEFFRGNKNAKIFVTDMFWQSDVLDAAVKKFADEQESVYIHIGDLGDKEENKAVGLFDHNGVASHPGDLGMQRIAERISKSIIQHYHKR